VSQSAPCEKLAWDSQFFGLSIARAIPARVDQAECDAMLAWCRDQRIECLYFLCPIAETSTQRLLAEADFQLVDVRVTLTRPAEAGTGEVRGRTRAATVDDVLDLREIALRAHRDARFHADGRFDPARCDELYATWIEKSVHGYADRVIVADRDNSAVGYVTLHLPHAGDSSRTARIGLVGVHEHWRNHGIGRELLRAAADTIRVSDVAETTVATSGKNVAAMRLYKSEGFGTTDVSLWYHRWFGDRRL
jgi:ribosomal protein S18 acetylase RimI-like enzyme